MRTLRRTVLTLAFAPWVLMAPVRTEAAVMIQYDSQNRIESATGISLSDGNDYRLDVDWLVPLDASAPDSGLSVSLLGEAVSQVVSEGTRGLYSVNVSTYVIFSGTDLVNLPGGSLMSQTARIDRHPVIPANSSGFWGDSGAGLSAPRAYGLYGVGVFSAISSQPPTPPGSVIPKPDSLANPEASSLIVWALAALVGCAIVRRRQRNSRADV